MTSAAKEKSKGETKSVPVGVSVDYDGVLDTRFYLENPSHPDAQRYQKIIKEAKTLLGINLQHPYKGLLGKMTEVIQDHQKAILYRLSTRQSNYYDKQLQKEKKTGLCANQIQKLHGDLRECFKNKTISLSKVLDDEIDRVKSDRNNGFAKMFVDDEIFNFKKAPNHIFFSESNYQGGQFLKYRETNYKIKLLLDQLEDFSKNNRTGRKAPFYAFDDSKNHLIGIQRFFYLYPEKIPKNVELYFFRVDREKYFKYYENIINRAKERRNEYKKIGVTYNLPDKEKQKIIVNAPPYIEKIKIPTNDFPDLPNNKNAPTPLAKNVYLFNPDSLLTNKMSNGICEEKINLIRYLYASGQPIAFTKSPNFLVKMALKNLGIGEAHFDDYFPTYADREKLIKRVKSDPYLKEVDSIYAVDKTVKIIANIKNKEQKEVKCSKQYPMQLIDDKSGLKNESENLLEKMISLDQYSPNEPGEDSFYAQEKHLKYVRYFSCLKYLYLNYDSLQEDNKNRFVCLISRMEAFLKREQERTSSDLLPDFASRALASLFADFVNTYGEGRWREIIDERVQDVKNTSEFFSEKQNFPPREQIGELGFYYYFSYLKKSLAEYKNLGDSEKGNLLEFYLSFYDSYRNDQQYRWVMNEIDEVNPLVKAFVDENGEVIKNFITREFKIFDKLLEDAPSSENYAALIRFTFSPEFTSAHPLIQKSIVKMIGDRKPGFPNNLELAYVYESTRSYTHSGLSQIFKFPVHLLRTLTLAPLLGLGSNKLQMAGHKKIAGFLRAFWWLGMWIASPYNAYRLAKASSRKWGWLLGVGSIVATTSCWFGILSLLGGFKYDAFKMGELVSWLDQTLFHGLSNFGASIGIGAYSAEIAAVVGLMVVGLGLVVIPNLIGSLLSEIGRNGIAPPGEDPLPVREEKREGKSQNASLVTENSGAIYKHKNLIAAKNENRTQSESLKPFRKEKDQECNASSDGTPPPESEIGRKIPHEDGVVDPVSSGSGYSSGRGQYGGN